MGSSISLKQHLGELDTDTALQQLLLAIVSASIEISDIVRQSPLHGGSSTGSTNVHGEEQKELDLIANDILIKSVQNGGSVAAMASEELDDILLVDATAQTAPYLLVFDPLDGSSNIEVNVSIGTIFSVLNAPDQQIPTAADFLQTGTSQVCAGYLIYGPATQLMLTTGKGTHCYTLNTHSNTFELTIKAVTLSPTTQEFAINASNQRHWESPVQRYVEQCLAGETGPRKKNFNMRWIASMVAEVHRILNRGGVFLYPLDHREPRKPGRLRLLYEANPMAMLIEQAGGAASTGRQRMLEVKPTELHQRIPVILGSRDEVQHIEAMHAA